MAAQDIQNGASAAAIAAIAAITAITAIAAIAAIAAITAIAGLQPPPQFAVFAVIFFSKEDSAVLESQAGQLALI